MVVSVTVAASLLAGCGGGGDGPVSSAASQGGDRAASDQEQVVFMRELSTHRGLSMVRRAAPAATAVAVGLASPITVMPTATAHVSHRASSVTWSACPTYSNEVLRARGVENDRVPQFRSLLARTMCGTVSVPLDYRRPKGRQITVAVTKLKAVDQAHRLGSIALNPGGPGGSGYLMPIDIVLANATNARLNDRYDLIGFDPRGIGYSTKVDCPDPGPSDRPVPGPLTEDTARQIYDRQVRENQACGNFDPTFLGQLNTANVARDLEQVRIALHERRLNFLGISWGTWLGAVYRSTFPGSAGRMFLDSVAIPRFRVDAFEDGRAAAAERNFSRMAAWIAQHHETYGLGTSRAGVTDAILQLRRAYDANPKEFTDLDLAADGSMIAILASQDSPTWPMVTKALIELRDATGPTAPPTVQEIFSGGRGQPIPADAPEEFNQTMNSAAFCNEDPSRLNFSFAWAAYQRRLTGNPITGPANKFSAGCAGWPLPVQATAVHRTDGSLVLSGHRYESIAPYEWATQMQSTIGGALFTVSDDIHGSVVYEPDCAVKMMSYFYTGRIESGCAGAPGALQPGDRTMNNLPDLTQGSL
jgi:pimeloyl-ACP methyl ester carboxylesterase